MKQLLMKINAVPCTVPTVSLARFPKENLRVILI